STGKAVRGAVGHFRATNGVELVPENDGTRVVVEGEVALAGALGSVAQKVITKQAEMATTQFAQNLEQALSGNLASTETEMHGDSSKAASPSARGAVQKGRDRAAMPAPAAAPAVVYAADPWGRVAAGLSAVSLVLSVIILWQVS